MAADDLHEIMRALGRVEEGLARVSAELIEEKDRTSDHRSVMYGKLDRVEENRRHRRQGGGSGSGQGGRA